MKVGTTIAGRFLLERRAGQGGMGAVYEALDHRRTTALVRNEQAMLLLELGAVERASDLAPRAVEALAAAPARSGAPPMAGR